MTSAEQASGRIAAAEAEAPAPQATWLVRAAALGLALMFSAGMAVAFELALDSTLLGG
jgi:hypothetical protein